MGKERNKQVVLGVLGLAVVAVWIRGLTVPVGPGRERAAQPAHVSAPVAQARKPAGPAEPRPRTRITEWERNPFVLPGEGDAGVGDLVLNGVVWDEAYPLAMLGDQVVGVGEMVGKHRVVKITQTSVVVEKNGKEFVLMLGGQ